jgi:hypothetical protein
MARILPTIGRNRSSYTALELMYREIYHLVLSGLVLVQLGVNILDGFAFPIGLNRRKTISDFTFIYSLENYFNFVKTMESNKNFT